ncbi:unnamed protein product [Adineta steineri]|uniref:Uncharacterized protein n=1 Tax=Adineta steineri TaxID=433720 RepID=A0A818IRZ8_9BILA|nr:unnamed protein product [Adineta steineri]
MNTNDKQNFKLLLTVTQMKIFKINNTRSDDYFEEREIYDKTFQKRQTKLFCRYCHNNHPSLILRLVKEEQLLGQPTIFLFHDLVSN